MNDLWVGVVGTVCIIVALVVSAIYTPPKTAPEKERCMFDDFGWYVGGKTIGEQSCSGEMTRLAFWEGHPAQHLTGRLVCTGHMGSASELAAEITRDRLS